MSQDPVSDGFAALNERSQLPPPFKIEINYGNTKDTPQGDFEEEEKSKVPAGRQFMSRLHVETSFDRDDDMFYDGKHDTDDASTEQCKNRSTESSRSQRDFKATHVRGTHTAAAAVAAERISPGASPRPTLSLPKFARHAASAPLFRAVAATPLMVSPSSAPTTGQNSSQSRFNEYGILSDILVEREKDKEKDKEKNKERCSDIAWMAPRLSVGILDPIKGHGRVSITKLQHTGALAGTGTGGQFYCGSYVGSDNGDYFSDCGILVS